MKRSKTINFYQLKASALIASLAFGGQVFAASSELPTNGKVVVGTGAISQSGNVMTINQNTDLMAINWKTFNVGADSTVNFVQPNSYSVALNRVLGSDVSVIQGKINANGYVALVNPNGILFTPTAQVNVGGLIASTLNISNKNFINGNYTVSGKSSNAVINQGNITAFDGGAVMLIAAKVKNEGTIVANKGNVSFAAGSRVTLDFGGPVKVQVTKSAVDALIENGGAIKADGGMVYFTASAANAITTTVINNTGIIEAKTLSTGEKGEIHLLGDNVNDHIIVGGKLDVSAPNGGEEGTVTIDAASIKYTNSAIITLSAMNTIAETAEKAVVAAQAKVELAEKPVNNAKAKAEKMIANAEKAATNAEKAAEKAKANAEAKTAIANNDPTNTKKAAAAKKAADNAANKEKKALSKKENVAKVTEKANTLVANAEKKSASKISAAKADKAAAESKAIAARAKAIALATPSKTTPIAPSNNNPLDDDTSNAKTDAQRGLFGRQLAASQTSIKIQSIEDAPTAAGGDEDSSETESSNEVVINYLGDGINLPE
ncbi:MAG: filamentous hemagglutinin N-terminal domain-containing protein [Methylophilaceae bacterium]